MVVVRTEVVSPQREGLRPEVIDPRIADVEAVARWLDYAFRLPGGFRYGLSGLIGLVPGFGDVLDAVASLYIIGRAVQIGVPRVAVARMVLNVGIEAAGGALPFAGALIDTAFKANRRNYQLLRTHVSGDRRQRAKDWVFLILAAALVTAGIILPVIILVEIAKHIGR
jgi:Domain of unknown function (DUF4112)